jgi:uncharacterized membrane protein YbhN (UPF0104 family)
MEHVKRIRARRLIQAGIPLILLLLLFTQVPTHTLVSMLLHVDLAGLFISTEIYIGISLLRAVRVAMLAGRPVADAGKMMTPVLASSFANNVLPGRAGEPIFVWAAHRVLHMNWGAGAAIMLIMRVFDIMMVALIFIACVAFVDLQAAPAFLRWASLALGAGVGLIALLPWLGGAIVGLLERLATLAGRPKAVRFIQSEGRHAILAFERLRVPQAYAAVFVTSGLIWALNFVWIYLLTHSIGVIVTFEQSIVGTTFATFSRAIPLASIGGWGLHEVGWSAGYTLVGMPLEQAISSGFAVNTLMIMTSAVCGLPAWLSVLAKRRRTSVAKPTVGIESM